MVFAILGNEQFRRTRTLVLDDSGSECDLCGLSSISRRLGLLLRSTEVLVEFRKRSQFAVKTDKIPTTAS